MEKYNVGHYEPACMLAHRLLDKLSIIIGHCELVSEAVPHGSECAKRLDRIHSVAAEMAADLSTHQCQITETVRNLAAANMTTHSTAAWPLAAAKPHPRQG
jgi:hypothetical protein